MAAKVPAPRVLVVSLQKAGTHLVAQLMQTLGYRVEGLVNIGDWEHRPPVPLYPAALDERGEQALDLLRWLDRLGGNIRSRFSAAWHRAIEHNGDPVRRALDRFSDLPDNLCLITHDLRLKDADGGFLREWSRTGRPPIVFTYRDPRDVLVSFVNYLTCRTCKKRHGGFTEYYLYEQILANLPDDDARLMHAILDDNFPGHDEFPQHLWLLRHPRVCAVSFEELVGAAGGGSDEACERAVGRVIDHLGVAAEPRGVASSIYDENAFTFSRGRIGAWRERFTPAHLAAFDRRFGDLLPLYGYEPCTRTG